jgi:hypothetical protein
VVIEMGHIKSHKKCIEPWYCVGMVWLMITLPLIAVIASLITVGIAVKHAPELVERQSQQSINKVMK